MSDVRAHVFISGQVQGVYYRASTKETAESFGISGWVKNLSDGRVEAVFEGEEEHVAQIIEWCHSGSERASVEDVDVTYSDSEDLDGFEIRY